jgi:hypothetical protein
MFGIFHLNSVDSSESDYILSNHDIDGTRTFVKHSVGMMKLISSKIARTGGVEMESFFNFRINFRKWCCHNARRTRSNFSSKVSEYADSGHTTFIKPVNQHKYRKFNIKFDRVR